MSTAPAEEPPPEPSGPSGETPSPLPEEIAELAARCAELNAAIAAHLKMLKGM